MNALTRTEVRKNQSQKQKDSGLVFEPTKNLISNAMLVSIAGIEPAIGMGATLCFHADRHAATITKIKEYRYTTLITVQEDIAVRTDKNGVSFDQKYDYKPNPEGREYSYRYKDGRWVGAKESESGRVVLVRHNPALIIGVRDHFFDFSTK